MRNGNPDQPLEFLLSVLAVLTFENAFRRWTAQGFLRFVQLLLRAVLVITDSGGVQEEAAALGIPLLVARRTSERMEAVEAGVAEMVGPDADRILASASRLLGDPQAWAQRARPTPVFGDGRAGPRIAAALLRAFA